ncbi:MAG: glutamine-hydrolyzing GMP synthase, partial [Actinomycetota bacterium]
MSPAEEFDRVLVVDLGAQYAKLIARRVRECHVFSEIVPHDISVDDLLAKKPKGIILSGGPKSVYEPGAPLIDEKIFQAGVPIFGICYGHQLMAQHLGGEVAKAPSGEFGRTDFESTGGALFEGSPLEQTVWMSHNDAVAKAPEGFRTTGSTASSPVAAMEDLERRFFGVQFHPEVAHTPYGTEVLKNFLYKG